MRSRHCGGCNRESIVRIDALDAYACRGCDRWHSKPCSSSKGECSYCDELRKYERPSDVPKEWNIWDDPWNT